MNPIFSSGIWPVMLTPFTADNKIDYPALANSIQWYQSNGANGLFAVCQSSEMFFLTLEERVQLARFVKSNTSLPVVASGHIASRLQAQKQELLQMAGTGIDALILITNRLAAENEGDDVFLENLTQLLQVLPKELPLGFYECPYPYKRLLSPAVIRFMVQSKRFYFIKDTSCSVQNITNKLKLIQNSSIKLYNANTATLLQTLALGAAGYSGVMANFHPQLYRWLLDNYKASPAKAQQLQQILTMCALIESRAYPRCAKYMQKLCGNHFTLVTRNPGTPQMAEATYEEVNQLAALSTLLENWLQQATT